jgi:hypothetical protein
VPFYRIGETQLNSPDVVDRFGGLRREGFPQFTLPREVKLRAMKIPLEIRYPNSITETIEGDSTSPQPAVGDHIVAARGALYVVAKRVFVYRPKPLQGIVLHVEAAD